MTLTKKSMFADVGKWGGVYDFEKVGGGFRPQDFPKGGSLRRGNPIPQKG